MPLTMESTLSTEAIVGLATGIPLVVVAGVTLLITWFAPRGSRQNEEERDLESQGGTTAN